MRFRIVAAPVIAVAVIALAGCSSDSDDKTSETTSATSAAASATSKAAAAPTKPDFIASADKICSDGLKSMETELGPSPSAPTDADFEKLQKVLVNTTEDMLDKLRDLTPPTGDEATIKDLLDSFEATITKFEKASVEEFKQLTASTGEDEFDKKATAYGMKECGSA